MTTGTALCAESRRILSASSPSMAGMWMSMSTSENRSRSSILSTSRPFSASTTVQSNSRTSNRLRIVRIVEASSARRTFITVRSRSGAIEGDPPADFAPSTTAIVRSA